MYSPPSVPPLCFAKRGNVVRQILFRKILFIGKTLIDLSIKHLLPLYEVEREAGRVSTGRAMSGISVLIKMLRLFRAFLFYRHPHTPSIV